MLTLFGLQESFAQLHLGPNLGGSKMTHPLPACRPALEKEGIQFKNIK